MSQIRQKELSVAEAIDIFGLMKKTAEERGLPALSDAPATGFEPFENKIGVFNSGIRNSK